MADKEREPLPINRSAEQAGDQQEGGRDPSGTPNATDRDQAGALGGHVATRSNTRETPDDEKAG